jgi:hypothetical protein
VRGEGQVSAAATDTALDGRPDSTSGGTLSNEPQNRPKPVKRAGTSSTGSSPDAVSLEEIRAIRRRLYDGFYQKREVVDAIADAIKKELRLDP